MKIKLIDWFMCDDVRQEVNGKSIFIGVYQDDILINSLPALLPQLVLYSKWDTTTEPIRKFEASIKQPNGKIMGPVAGEISQNIAGKATNKSIVQIAMSPFKIEVSGKYEVDMKINDLEYSLGFFEVKLYQPPSKTE